MARCTAPVQGHRTASGRAACPACGGGGRGYGGYSGYGSYSSPSYSTPSGTAEQPEQWRRVRARPCKAEMVASRFVFVHLGRQRCGHSRRFAYSVENPAKHAWTSGRLFRHAWDGRQGAAKEFSHDLAPVTWGLSLFSGEGRWPRRAVATRHRQGFGELASLGSCW